MVKQRPWALAPAVALSLATHLLPPAHGGSLAGLAQTGICMEGPRTSPNPHLNPFDRTAFVSPVFNAGMMRSVSSNTCLQGSRNFASCFAGNGRGLLDRRALSRVLNNKDQVGTVLNARMSGQNQPDQTVLFVGNLPWAMDSYGLRKVFETCGEVLTAQVMRQRKIPAQSRWDCVFLLRSDAGICCWQISFDNRNDRSRGFGHVVFK